MKKAIHKFINSEVVDYKKIVRNGETLVWIKFKSGEVTDMTQKRLNELFTALD